ncbi:hypothetical protein D9619_012556 [Psilocybe cf. subviscida]|uniref:Uncharacterized protein n=1 Tax=Psilocybe cf. subviscida TaxID=2480587 RepID=A0A8H5B7Z3_9AGAR|nr:hypothetical protein D9619_012556 [Psilocybe cf. subviscida]
MKQTRPAITPRHTSRNILHRKQRDHTRLDAKPHTPADAMHRGHRLQHRHKGAEHDQRRARHLHHKRRRAARRVLEQLEQRAPPEGPDRGQGVGVGRRAVVVVVVIFVLVEAAAVSWGRQRCVIFCREAEEAAGGGGPGPAVCRAGEERWGQWG